MLHIAHWEATEQKGKTPHPPEFLTIIPRIGKSPSVYSESAKGWRLGVRTRPAEDGMVPIARGSRRGRAHSTVARANSVRMELNSLYLFVADRIFCGEPVPTSPENALVEIYAVSLSP